MGALLLPNVTGFLESADAAQAPVQAAKTPMSAGRERLLADFGWRFHLGHANDPALDFGYGRGNAFAKSGSFIPGGGRGNPAVTSNQFTGADWTPEVMRLTDRDINGIRNLLDVKRITREHEAYMEKIAGRITEVLSITTDQHAYDFLAKLLKDYNYLTSRK